MGFGHPSSVAMALAEAPALPRGLVGFIIQVSRWHQLALAALSTLVFLLTIAPLELQRRIVDDALHGSAFAPVLLLALAYAGLALTEGAIKLLSNIYRAWVGESAVRLLRARVQHHLTDLPAARLTAAIDGVSISMMLAEADDIGGFIGASLSEPLLQGGTLASVFGYMVYMQPVMALVSFVIFVPQVVFVPLIQRAINRRVSRRIRILRRVGVAIVADPLSATGERQRERLDIVFRLNIAMFELKFTMNFLMNLLYHLGNATIFGLGGWYVLRGDIEVGTIVAFVSGTAKINDPWGDLVNWYRDFTVTRAKYHLIARALEPVRPAEAIPAG
jgi:ABC-type multidrug transport system fused ATPase/permease subunit